MALATATANAQSIEIGSTGLNRWWRVAGGLMMNIALGTLYAWSVFVAPLEKEFGWKRADTSMVFTIAVVVFALTFIVAGRLQDKFGPFWVVGQFDFHRTIVGGLAEEAFSCVDVRCR